MIILSDQYPSQYSDTKVIVLTLSHSLVKVRLGCELNHGM